MVRGVARRSLFESRADFRFFLAHLARSVRRGEIEVHGFVLMDNHVHLAVRSLQGKLSEAMRRILSCYVKGFNRRVGRDGPLLRSRFNSKPVTTLAYRRFLVRYIHDNPVAAAMVANAEDYEWASARHYLRKRGPIWLCRTWIESEVRGLSRRPAYDPECFNTYFPSRISPDMREWVQRKLLREPTGNDPLDELFRGETTDVRRWFLASALQADGRTEGSPVVPPTMLEQAIAAAKGRAPEWRTARGRRCLSAWPTVEAGLMRSVCGLSYSEVALRLGIPRTTVQSRIQAHRQALCSDSEYALQSSEIAAEAVALLKREW
jgi:REP element-mobilizing transposase RayT